ncbi:transmembrane anchor protein [Xanthobacter autotrophicus]|uniref:transmembrane anchor protein n=1 Tax=Xanthobacter autotrophicus TaxID=280 RepID=UPI001E64B927|nr:transmembrane anchor protein [Xanthobacter autotrophicus]UDQ91709.1 transmembrane anchor protein [Xanthobacter autotrophicus]
MYNTDLPARADLPTSRQLLRSTLIAIVAAAAILVTIVLPAEYAIDPTGIGRMLGLAEMGEIKAQLAEEAEKDRTAGQQGAVPVAVPTPDRRSGLLDRLFAELLISPAAAQTTPARRNDEMSITLKPGEGAEVKMVMVQGAKVNFSWAVTGGVVNFDLHGDGGGQETSYQKGRGVPGADGVLEAAFDGNHGWFWRNRGTSDVTVTLRTSGSYAEIKRAL